MRMALFADECEETTQWLTETLLCPPPPGSYRFNQPRFSCQSHPCAVITRTRRVKAPRQAGFCDTAMFWCVNFTPASILYRFRTHRTGFELRFGVGGGVEA